MQCLQLHKNQRQVYYQNRLTFNSSDLILYITVRQTEGDMAYYTHTKNPIGAFQEKDTGNWFEFSNNDEPWNNHLGEDFPHKVWVGGEGVCGMTGWRFANVMKTRAVIVVDEDEFGLPVVEKWYTKKHREYVL